MEGEDRVLGGRSDVRLTWTLGTGLTRTLCRTRSTPSPLQPELALASVCSYKPDPHALADCCSVYPLKERREHGFAWRRQGRCHRMYLNNCRLRLHFKPG